MALGLNFRIFARDDASGALNNVGDSADRAGGKLKGIGKAAAVGLAGATVAAGIFGNDAVNAFAAVEDATGAAGVQFGKALPQITAFADKAFSSFGLSKRAALDAANTFGTLGKSAGLQGKPLAKFSTDFAGLAGDLASFKGTSTEQAIEAVGAALRGEAEPIRAYGVLLDDASLRQEALKQGLIKTTKEALTPQQKVLATQALLYKQTADAQGDFARTSDSTANTQKRLQAATENAKAALGEKLAPAFTAVRTAMLKLIQGSTTLIDFLGDKLGPPIRTLLAGFKGLGTASGETGSFLNKLGLAFRALVLAFKDGDVTSNGLVGRFEKIGVAARQVFDFLKANAKPILIGLGVAFVAITAPVTATVAALGFLYFRFQAVREAVSAVASFVQTQAVPAFVALGSFLAAQVVPVLKSLWATIQTQILPALQGLFARVMENKELFITIGTVIGGFIAVVVIVASKLATILIPVLGTLIRVQVAVIGSIIGIVAAFVRFGQKLVEIGGAIGRFVSSAVGLIKELPSKALAALSSLASTLLSAARRGFDGFKTGIREGTGSVLTFVRGIPGKILTAVGDVGRVLYNKGKEIIGGLIQGIKDAATGIAGSVGGAISDGISKIPGAGLVGSIIPGHRAVGGSISANSPYIVGERGPELIFPSRAGFVATARQSAGFKAGQPQNAGSDPALGVLVELMQQQIDLLKQGNRDRTRQPSQFAGALVGAVR